MAHDKQFPDVEWNLADPTTGKIGTWQQVEIAVLMDIRRELHALNNLLRCPLFQEIPWTLRSIKRNTAKKRKPKRKP